LKYQPVCTALHNPNAFHSENRAIISSVAYVGVLRLASVRENKQEKSWQSDNVTHITDLDRYEIVREENKKKVGNLTKSPTLPILINFNMLADFNDVINYTSFGCDRIGVFVMVLSKMGTSYS
jgi:hypothetical protein